LLQNGIAIGQLLIVSWNAADYFTLNFRKEQRPAVDLKKMSHFTSCSTTLPGTMWTIPHGKRLE